LRNSGSATLARSVAVATPNSSRNCRRLISNDATSVSLLPVWPSAIRTPRSRSTRSVKSVIGAAMSALVEIINHGNEVEHGQTRYVLHSLGVRRQHGAFEHDCAHVGITLYEFLTAGNSLGLDKIGVEVACLFKDCPLEVRPVLHAPDDHVDLALDPSKLQHPVAEIGAARRDAADRARRLEHLSQKRDLQEARHENG